MALRGQSRIGEAGCGEAGKASIGPTWRDLVSRCLARQVGQGAFRCVLARSGLARLGEARQARQELAGFVAGR